MHSVDEGDLTVIRPGIYCRERQLRDFSYTNRLPVINENCPACFEAPKERHHIKKFLTREEGTFSSLFPSLRKALFPLLHPSVTQVLSLLNQPVSQRKLVPGQHRYKDVVSRIRSTGFDQGKFACSFQGDDNFGYDTVPNYSEVHDVSCEKTLTNASVAEIVAELFRRQKPGQG